MEIKIIVEDTEKGIHWQATAKTFETAEMWLGSFERQWEALNEKGDDENEDEVSEDYPLGGMIEPYDIWKEDEMMDKTEDLLIDALINEQLKK